MNLTNLDQTIKQFESPTKIKCHKDFQNIELKSQYQFDLQQQNQIFRENVQSNRNDKNNVQNNTNFLNKNNQLFASIQQVIDMQRLFEYEKNELEQRITEQRIHEELNLKQKQQEYEENVKQFNIQKNDFNNKLQETQQLFKLSNIIEQKDNQQEIISKLIQENHSQSIKFNNIIYEQQLKQNQQELQIQNLTQQLQYNHLQLENYRSKYSNLKFICRKKLNIIIESILQLIEIKQSINLQLNRMFNFNNQILEQLQVFINQRKELEKMERIHQSNLELIKQLRYSQNELINEKLQFKKQIELQQLQLLQYKEQQLQNHIDSEKLKQKQKFHLENQTNKFCDFQTIDQTNDFDVKSEYADENNSMNNNEGRDQELLSEEPCNNSIENNNNQTQLQNIYLEGESQIENDDTKKENLLSLKQSKELQGQSITQKMEFINQKDVQDKLKQTDDDDQNIQDIQFDDDFNDVLIQMNTEQDIKQIILKDETPLDNNIINFDQAIQQLEENNQQSGWDFEGI